jgi:microcystin-dependent protein
MSDPYLAEIRLFGGNFAPYGWALCDGRLLPISANAALFSVLGTTYGGDGVRTFALPNLQGRTPMHWGDGPGLTPHGIGETGGSATVTLVQTAMPAHTHTAQGPGSPPDGNSPLGAGLGDAPIYAGPPDNQVMTPGAVQPAGGSQPHNNMAPYLTCTFIIALQGIYPSRS